MTIKRGVDSHGFLAIWGSLLQIVEHSRPYIEYGIYHDDAVDRLGPLLSGEQRHEIHQGPYT